MNGTEIDQAMKLASQHQRSHELAESEKICRWILAKKPGHAEALRLLGVIAVQVGHVDAGIEIIQRAIVANPGVAHYHVDLGNALRISKRIDEAVAAFQAAIRIDPTDTAAHCGLGVVLAISGRLEDAMGAFREAVRLKPDFAEAHNNLGNALRENRQWRAAIAACRRAIEINPDFAEAYFNLGSALRLDGDLDGAISAYQRAIQIKPDFPEFHSNLGNALKDRRRLPESIAAYREALRLKPEFAVAHVNLGHAFLLSGDFKNGWLELEWRLKMDPWHVPHFPGRRWNGEDLRQRTLVLWGEQGLGDTIQFSRYAGLLAERGGRIVTWVRPELARLLRSNPDLGEIVPSDAGVPMHDFHCPLMSLPVFFNTRLETIPTSQSYLSCDPSLAQLWKKKLGQSDKKLRVGLAWAGNPQFREDRTRSLLLERLASLGATANVDFYSLQKGLAGEEAKNPPAGLNLKNLGPELNDFADTAAVMSLMDLIISTDTSVPHLAGALGRPVWLMLQFVPDYRWLLERADTPWYPTMRLFRQESPGDWDGVIARVAETLTAFRH